MNKFIIKKHKNTQIAYYKNISLNWNWIFLFYELNVYQNGMNEFMLVIMKAWKGWWTYSETETQQKLEKWGR